LEPVAGAPAPASWIGLAGGLIDLNSLLANDLGCSTVSMMGRHEFDVAVAVPLVVPIHKCSYPFACFVLAGKVPAGVVVAVFDRRKRDSEYGLSLDPLGLEKDLSTPISSSRDSSVASRIALPLTAWRIRGCCWHWLLPKQPMGRW